MTFKDSNYFKPILALTIPSLLVIEVKHTETMVVVL